MTAIEAESGGTPETAALYSTWRKLHEQRLDLDRRTIALGLDSSGGDLLWQKLEDVLSKLRDTTAQLAKTSATQLIDIRAKAEVLVMVLSADDGGDAQIVPDDTIRALALSLAKDVASLSG